PEYRQGRRSCPRARPILVEMPYAVFFQNGPNAPAKILVDGFLFTLEAAQAAKTAALQLGHDPDAQAWIDGVDDPPAWEAQDEQVSDSPGAQAEAEFRQAVARLSGPS